MLFRDPTPTRYDLQFGLGGIPVRVHPLFWLIALLFGAGAGSLAGILIWIGGVFISILIHELGHAVAMRFFGRGARVVLYAGGGLTFPEPVAWGYRQADVGFTVNQEILVSLAGPFAGFLFAGVVLAAIVAAGGSMEVTFLFGFLPIPVADLPGGGGLFGLAAATLLWINIFWGLINLTPVFPLDGGNVSRYLWLKADPWQGVNRSLWLSVIAGTAVAVAGFFVLHSTYIGLLFGLLAFQSYQMVQGRPSL